MNLASGMVISGVPSSVFIEMLFLSVFACSCLGVIPQDGLVRRFICDAQFAPLPIACAC